VQCLMVRTALGDPVGHEAVDHRGGLVNGPVQCEEANGGMNVLGGVPEVGTVLTEVVVSA
jgi:hypothetical protein